MHRAVGLRADGERHHARRPRRRPSRTTSRRACAPGRAGLRVLPGVKTASSVVTVLPMMTAPGRAQALHHRRIRRGPAARVEDGAVLGRHVARVDDVLERHRHAVQRRRAGGRCRDSGRPPPPARMTQARDRGRPRPAPRGSRCGDPARGRRRRASAALHRAARDARRADRSPPDRRGPRLRHRRDVSDRRRACGSQ